MAKAKTNESTSKAAKVVTSGASVSDTLELINAPLDSEKETKYIPTGNIGFDFALSEGKGLPLGASILLWADPGCGKSTLLADVSKRLLDASKRAEQPFKILYIAAEGSLELMVSMGLGKYIKSNDFIYIEKSLSWRQIEMFYDSILNGQHPVYKDVKVVIIDSVNNILSDANLDKSAADGDYGTRARERSMFYSKYFPLCKEKEINTFLISQVRHNQEAAGMYVDKRKAAVSYADKHNVDIILKCSKSTSDPDVRKESVKTAFETTEDVKDYIIKMTSCATDCKNRYCEGLPSRVLMTKGGGADNAYVIRKLLEALGYVKASGGWFSFDQKLCDKFGFPTTNLRKEVLMDLIRKNIGQIVSFLKEAGLYGLRVTDAKPAEDVIDNSTTPKVEDTPKTSSKKGK